jgi:hypothetical protein
MLGRWADLIGGARQEHADRYRSRLAQDPARQPRPDRSRDGFCGVHGTTSWQLHAEIGQTYLLCKLLTVADAYKRKSIGERLGLT